MIYRLDQVRLGLFEAESALDAAVHTKLRQKAGRRADRLSYTYDILHKAPDFRKKGDPKWVYTIAVHTTAGLHLPVIEQTDYRIPTPKNLPDTPPVIIGFGPCGLFAGLILAEAGLSPIILERGAPMEERVMDVAKFWNGGPVNPESNVQYGEGGAGTFSDGKLTTGINDSRVSHVLNTFVKAGAPEEIRYTKRPHLGTDKLRELVPKLRKQIEDLGGEVRFHAKAEDFMVEDDAIKGVLLQDGSVIQTAHVILAVGHSARDTFSSLHNLGVAMTPKPFSIGFRIEHPQELIDAAQYGQDFREIAEIAGPANYKLHTHLDDGRGLYTFCMCPGGEVVMAATEAGTIVTNGMSNYARDTGFANSALLVDVLPEDVLTDFGEYGVLAGAHYQRHYEKLAFENGGGKAPSCVLGEYQEQPGRALRNSLPGFAVKDLAAAFPIFDRKLQGFSDPNARLIGVETRSSSPVRILRGEDGISNIKGLYPAGEGAGYAGGITSAAVDGMRMAEAVISQL